MLEKLCRLADTLPTRRVTARAYFGHYDGGELTILYGKLKGEATTEPRGNATYGIGTDFVFAPDGCDGKTRAELDWATYSKLYNTLRAADGVRDFLRSQ